MSSSPRNPRFFPRMKVRGSQRRSVAPFQRVARGFDRVGVAASRAAEALAGLTIREETES